MTFPWTLRAWPPVLCQAGRTPALRFHHLATLVLNAGEHDQPRTGQTLWGSAGTGGEEAGVAWDWVQLMPGVVAMADPMSVVTNLRLVGPEGEVLTAWEAARHLNDIVHMLPWQQEVNQALASH